MDEEGCEFEFSDEQKNELYSLLEKFELILDKERKNFIEQTIIKFVADYEFERWCEKNGPQKLFGELSESIDGVEASLAEAISLVNVELSNEHLNDCLLYTSPSPRD